MNHPLFRQWNRIGLAILALLTLGLLNGVLAPLQLAHAKNHRRLEIINRFRSAEEVLAYFLDRDAEGFVWSGLLDSERQEFTTWRKSPAHDSFHLATRVRVSPVNPGSTASRRIMSVTYDLESMQDAAGTSAPPPSRELTVRFILVREEGKWKIAEPSEEQFVPVLLHSRIGPLSGPKRSR